MIQVGEVASGLGEPAIDRAKRSAESGSETDDEQRERPRNVKEGAHIEQRDPESLREADRRVYRDRRAVCLDEKDVRDLAGGPPVEEIEVRALQPLEQRRTQARRHPSLEPRGEELRDVRREIFRGD